MQIHAALEPYVLSDAKYVQVRDMLNDEMDKGLGKATNKDAIVKMFPTYVRSLPDGSGELILCVQVHLCSKTNWPIDWLYCNQPA